MKKIILLSFLVFSFMGAEAQYYKYDYASGRLRPVTPYQGEFSLGYGTGIHEDRIGRFYAETIHGVTLASSRLFVGAGMGLAMFDWGSAFVPVFGSVKYYITRSQVRPYLLANLGYGFGDDLKGLYGMGGFGVDFSIGFNMGLFVNLGYQIFGMNTVDHTGYYKTYDLNAVLFQVGLRF